MSTVISTGPRPAMGFEQITISTSVLPLTAAKMKTFDSGTAARVEAKSCLISTGADKVRYTLDGTAPTTLIGHEIAAASVLTIEGMGNMTNARFIRSGAADSIITVTYFS